MIKYTNQNNINNLFKDSQKIALVPTMGALHDGHLFLVNIAKNYSENIIVSIFVNPTQFSENEDFSTYPKNVENDLEKLENAGVKFVYLPTVNDIYPSDDFVQTYKTGKLGSILEGVARPHFFDGVAQVVSRLFEIIKPDIAIFGEKDFQQLAVIKKMVTDLKLDVEIIGAPIIRESDGLAMSSRNIYLNDSQRKIAPELFKTLSWTKEQIKKGNDFKNVILESKKILLNKGFDKIDYLKLCDVVTLQEVDNYSITNNCRLIATVNLGETRLLDNIAV